MGLFTKLFGTRSEREVKQIRPTVDKILSLENEYRNLSEEALKAKTQEFKDRHHVVADAVLSRDAPRIEKALRQHYEDVGLRLCELVHEG